MPLCSTSHVCPCHGFSTGLLPIWVWVNPCGFALDARLPCHAHGAVFKWNIGLVDLLPLPYLSVSCRTLTELTHQNTISLPSPVRFCSHMVNASGENWQLGLLDFTACEMVLVLKLISVAAARQDAWQSKKKNKVRLHSHTKLLIFLFKYVNSLMHPGIELVSG